jgi:hypothetical protein
MRTWGCGVLRLLGAVVAVVTVTCVVVLATALVVHLAR